MDNINLRKNIGNSLNIVISAAAFCIGSAAVVLARSTRLDDIMYIFLRFRPAAAVLGALVVLMLSVSVLVPFGRTISALTSLLVGAVCEVTAYCYAADDIFSVNYIVASILGLLLTFAALYLSDRAVTLSIQLREHIRSDKRLCSKLHAYFAFVVFFALLVLVSAAALMQ